MFPAGMTPVNPSALHYPGTPMSDMSLFSDLEFQSSTPWNSSSNISGNGNSGAHGSTAPVFDMIFPSMGASGGGLGGLTPAAMTGGHSSMKRGPFGSSSGGSAIHARSVWMHDGEAGGTPMASLQMTSAPNSAERTTLEVQYSTFSFFHSLLSFVFHLAAMTIILCIYYSIY